MRMLLQRVLEARVEVAGAVVGSVGRGYVVLLGIGPGDDAAVADRLCDKLVKLRLFADERGRFDRSLLDVGGGALVVSQFTLYGELRKGNRPSFTGAASPAVAEPLCEYVVEALRARGVVEVGSGVFGAAMAVSLVNDGPVTLMLDSAAV